MVALLDLHTNTQLACGTPKQQLMADGTADSFWSSVASRYRNNPLATVLGFIAVICATSNIVGGFLITDRMLKMFRKDDGSAQAEKNRRAGNDRRTKAG